MCSLTLSVVYLIILLADTQFIGAVMKYTSQKFYSAKKVLSIFKKAI